jgi:BirA family biotin operon repressor/biotin-[acetyl-CoA-carboxylase] ligase
MDHSSLQACISGLPLGLLRYFDSVGSTNDEATRWAEEGAPHLSLVVAGEQTSGKGRMGRRWYTRPGGALAVSLVLRPDQLGLILPPRITGLGALAVCEALQENYGLGAQVKWPNDVLVGDHKLAGVLVEASWLGEELQAAILGIGINVALDSVPPAGELDFPATSVEAALGSPVDRWGLLRNVLEALLIWLPYLDQARFLQAWQGQLAYLHEWVQLIRDGEEPVEGRMLGLGDDGSLLLESPSGKEVTFQAGEIHLRAVDRS